MSIIDSWILMDKTALDVAWALAHPTNEDPIPDNVRILNQGIRGYWKDSGTDEVVNVLASQAELDQFIVDHAADVTVRYDWIQGPGYDALDTNGPTLPAAVLALMKDHVEYDENGDVISTTPASFSNPNWGHVFLGQKERIFAGDFSNDFSEEFF